MAANQAVSTLLQPTLDKNAILADRYVMKKQRKIPYPLIAGFCCATYSLLFYIVFTEWYAQQHLPFFAYFFLFITCLAVVAFTSWKFVEKSIRKKNKTIIASIVSSCIQIYVTTVVVLMFISPTDSIDMILKAILLSAIIYLNTFLMHIWFIIFPYMIILYYISLYYGYVEPVGTGST